MTDLYKRLATHGFDQGFVRQFVLPDWWDDSLASIPTNRAIAEGAISRMLRFSLAELADPDQSLSFPDLARLKLKKARKDTEVRDLRSTILLAEQTATALVRSLDLRRFPGTMSSRQAREAILQRRQFVDLDSLLDFAWECGIAVVHLSQMPKRLKKFSGLAMFAGNAPVIVLGAKTDSAPWLAFHLAHELGHILLGHVAVGSPVLADVDIGQVDTDEDEVAADRFGCELLTGIPEPTARAEYGMTAAKLASAVRSEAKRLRADPGVIALMYGFHAERMAVSQGALKLMGLDRGAHKTISDAFMARLNSDLPEVTERFVSLVTAA